MRGRRGGFLSVILKERGALTACESTAQPLNRRLKIDLTGRAIVFKMTGSLNF